MFENNEGEVDKTEFDVESATTDKGNETAGTDCMLLDFLSTDAGVDCDSPVCVSCGRRVAVREDIMKSRTVDENKGVAVSLDTTEE